MRKTTQISLYISNEALEKINKASKKVSRSRSNFLEVSGLKEAEKILNELDD